MSDLGDQPSTSKPPIPTIKRPGSAPSGEGRGGILRSPSEPNGLLSPDTPQPPGFPHSQSYPNIKFAPLPELAPRKRHSSVSLGVASRSSLLRASRQRNGVVYAFPSDGAEQQQQQQQQPVADDGTNAASSPDSSAVRRQSSKKRKEGKDATTRSRDRTGSDAAREQSKREEDIAMDELAKLVKGAGKKLFSWKKSGGAKGKGVAGNTLEQPRPDNPAILLTDEPSCIADGDVGDGLTVMEFLGPAKEVVGLDTHNVPYTVSDPSDLPDFPGLSTSTTPIISIDRTSSSSSETHSQEGSGYGEIGEGRRRSRTSSQAELAI